MKRLIITPIVCLLVALMAQAAAVGQWNYYIGYKTINHIEPAGNRVYVLVDGYVYSYNLSDQSITTYDKLTGLSDTKVDYIAWCESAKKLVIVYNNGNIDLVDSNDRVTNISDYYNKNLSTGKKINNISVSGNFVYMATQFGIVKLNVKKEEFDDTYNLGFNVDDVAVIDNAIFATSTTYHVADSTRNGTILRGDMRDNLLDKTTWTIVDTLATTRLFNVGGQLVGTSASYALRYNIQNKTHTRIGNNYSRLQKVCYTGGTLILLFANNALLVDAANMTMQTINISGITTIAYDSRNRYYWADQSDGCLQALAMDESQNLTPVITDIVPDGPKYNYFFFAKCQGGKYYSVGGLHQDQTFGERPATVQELMEDGSWLVYQDHIDTIVHNSLYSYKDMTCLEIDPKDDKHVYTGSFNGLYEFYDGKYQNYWSHKNSPLHEGWKDAGYRRVAVDGITFGDDGYLYVCNSYSTRSLFRMSPDYEWEDITPDEMEALITYSSDGKLMTGNVDNLKNLFFHAGYLWICNESYRTKGLFRVNVNTREVKMYTNFTNQDGAEVKADYVSCATPDKEGNIWIGTRGGLMMLTASELAADGEQLIQVKVPRNDGTNYADYLLDNTNITAIAVDEADRKWIGTYADGVYLISADNTQELHHFTTADSPLLSDCIESVAINNQTGEVFFGTNRGLCSYISDATTQTGEMTKDNVYAYPNPVRPDYTGLITITGLTLDADVKIVTANGSLVNEGRSNGGTYTWDGCNPDGKRVASGVYMVLTATSDGQKGVVCKIAIIN